MSKLCSSGRRHMEPSIHPSLWQGAWPANHPRKLHFDQETRSCFSKSLPESQISNLKFYFSVTMSAHPLHFSACLLIFLVSPWMLAPGTWHVSRRSGAKSGEANAPFLAKQRTTGPQEKKATKSSSKHSEVKHINSWASLLCLKVVAEKRKCKGALRAVSRAASLSLKQDSGRADSTPLDGLLADQGLPWANRGTELGNSKYQVLPLCDPAPHTPLD